MSLMGTKKNFYKFVYKILKLKTGSDDYNVLFKNLLEKSEGSFSAECIAKWFDMELIKNSGTIDVYQEKKHLFSNILYIISTAQILATDGKTHQKMLSNYQRFLEDVWRDFCYESHIKEWDEDIKRYDFVYKL